MSIFDTLVENREYIENALEYAEGTHTFDDIALGVLSGRYILWPGERSAIVTEIINYPQIKDLHFFLAGGDLDEVQLMTEYIERWGRDVGCSRSSFSGRRGWARVFPKDTGYETKYTTMIKDLTNA